MKIAFWTWILFLIVLAINVHALVSPTTTRNSHSQVHLRIVHFNDVYLLDNIPKFKGFLQTQKSDPAITKCICTLGGDFFSPSLLSSMDQGQAMVQCLSELGVDFACLGNHEADHGTEAFVKNVNDFKGTIINSNFPTMPLTSRPMPAFVRLQLHSQDTTQYRQIKLLGLLDNSPNLYLPNAFTPGAVEQSVTIREAVQLHLAGKDGDRPGAVQHSMPTDQSLQPKNDNDHQKQDDLIIPITHQDYDRDVELAQEFGNQQRMPFILGGHDHDPFGNNDKNDDVPCRVLKAGMDAELAIVIDVIWESSTTETPEVGVQFVDITALDDSYADADLQILVEECQAPLRQLDALVLKVIETRDLALSSVGTRKKQTTVGSLICTALRKALRADVAILNGGSIRGNSVYNTTKTIIMDDTIANKDNSTDDLKFFTFSDLGQEIPYETEICMVPLPGSVLQDTINYSRTCLGEQGGGFLQCCNKMEVVQDASGRYKILEIRGEPFDPRRIYNVATLHHLLTGMDDIKPLTTYMEKHPELLPSFDSARPAKELVLQVYYREIWLLLGTFDEIDTGADDYVCKDELAAMLSQKLGIDPTDDLVENMLKTFDFHDNGVVSREEYNAGMLAIQLNRFDLSPNDHKDIIKVMDVVKYINTAIQDPVERSQLLDRIEGLTLEHKKEGDILMKQGDVCKHMYICETGKVNFTADGKHVGSCTKSDSFGELALLYDSPRTKTCIAASDCTLWRLSRNGFRRIFLEETNKREQVKQVVRYLKSVLKQPTTRNQLKEIVSRERFRAGDTIFAEDDVGDFMYFCEKGRIHLLGDGEVVGICEEGGSFGEDALLYNTIRDVASVAQSDSVLWRINRATFHQLVDLFVDEHEEEPRKRIEQESSF